MKKLLFIILSVCFQAGSSYAAQTTSPARASSLRTNATTATTDSSSASTSTTTALRTIAKSNSSSGSSYDSTSGATTQSLGAAYIDADRNSASRRPTTTTTTSGSIKTTSTSPDVLQDQIEMLQRQLDVMQAQLARKVEADEVTDLVDTDRLLQGYAKTDDVEAKLEQKAGRNEISGYATVEDLISTTNSLQDTISQAKDLAIATAKADANTKIEQAKQAAISTADTSVKAQLKQYAKTEDLTNLRNNIGESLNEETLVAKGFVKATDVADALNTTASTLQAEIVTAKNAAIADAENKIADAKTEVVNTANSSVKEQLKLYTKKADLSEAIASTKSELQTEIATVASAAPNIDVDSIKNEAVSAANSSVKEQLKLYTKKADLDDKVLSVKSELESKITTATANAAPSIDVDSIKNEAVNAANSSVKEQLKLYAKKGDLNDTLDQRFSTIQSELDTIRNTTAAPDVEAIKSAVVAATSDEVEKKLKLYTKKADLNDALASTKSELQTEIATVAGATPSIDVDSIKNEAVSAANSSVKEQLKLYTKKADLDDKVLSVKSELRSEIASVANTAPSIDVDSIKNEAVSAANSSVKDQLKLYTKKADLNDAIASTKSELESRITTVANATPNIDVDSIKNEAINAANSSVKDQLKLYTKKADLNDAIASTKSELQSEIATVANATPNIDVDSIKTEIVAATNNELDKKLKTYTKKADLSDVIASTKSELKTEIATAKQAAIADADTSVRSQLQQYAKAEDVDSLRNNLGDAISDEKLIAKGFVKATDVANALNTTKSELQSAIATAKSAAIADAEGKIASAKTEVVNTANSSVKEQLKLYTKKADLNDALASTKSELQSEIATVANSTPNIDVDSIKNEAVSAATSSIKDQLKLYPKKADVDSAIATAKESAIESAKEAAIADAEGKFLKGNELTSKLRDNGFLKGEELASDLKGRGLLRNDDDLAGTLKDKGFLKNDNELLETLTDTGLMPTIIWEQDRRQFNDELTTLSNTVVNLDNGLSGKFGKFLDDELKNSNGKFKDLNDRLTTLDNAKDALSDRITNLDNGLADRFADKGSITTINNKFDGLDDKFRKKDDQLTVGDIKDLNLSEFTKDEDFGDKFDWFCRERDLDHRYTLNDELGTKFDKFLGDELEDNNGKFKDFADKDSITTINNKFDGLDDKFRKKDDQLTVGDISGLDLSKYRKTTDEITVSDISGLDLSQYRKKDDQLTVGDISGLDLSKYRKTTDEITVSDISGLDLSQYRKKTDQITTGDISGLDLSQYRKKTDQITTGDISGLDLSQYRKKTDQITTSDISGLDLSTYATKSELTTGLGTLSSDISSVSNSVATLSSNVSTLTTGVNNISTTLQSNNVAGSGSLHEVEIVDDGSSTLPKQPRQFEEVLLEP